MTSSSDFATVSAATVPAEDETAAEPVESAENDGAEPVNADGSLADLHRETAAMLRTLADRYEAESQTKRAEAARLRTESEANDSLAAQLEEESTRIRSDADRLGTQPTWVVAGTGDEATAVDSGAAPAGSSSDDAPPNTGDSPNVRSETTWTSRSDDVTAASDQPAQSFSDVEAVPGPGPARGFASSPEQSAEQGQSAESGPTSAQPSGSTEDWAPRPFESWRNKTSRVVPGLLGI